jgi:hypothetical protein
MNPEATTKERLRQFAYYTVENAISQMTPDIHQYTIIFDFKNSGIKNVSISQLKEISPVMQDCYPDRLFKAYAVNSGWLMRLLWNVMKRFLNTFTLRKVKERCNI